MMQMEFKQARHHFEIELQNQKSLKNRFVTYFLSGRQVVNKQLYKKYKELQINNGVHNLHGSLHIIKFSDNQDYGMILLKQQEFKILDLFLQRIEQIQLILATATNFSYMIASNSSSPTPNSIDKSDIIIHQTRDNINMNDLNNNSNNGQITKQQIEPPASTSNIEYQPNNMQKRNTFTIPQFQSRYNFGLESKLQQSNCNNHYLDYPKSLSRIPNNQQLNPQSFSNLNGLTEINQCVSNNFQPSIYNPKQGLHNKNQYNTRNQYQTVQYNQQCQEVHMQSFNQTNSLYCYLSKARLLLHTILSDIREYQLSCKELCCPEYKKYRVKWNSKESKFREDYENELQYKNNDEEQHLKYKQFISDVKNIQQQLFYLNQNYGNYPDNCLLDLILANDIQAYSIDRKKNSIYTSLVNRIEDLHQQRTHIINLRLILENFVKVLSVGEKTCIYLEQYQHIDPDILTNEEKQKLREVYGEQIIEESSERVFLVPNMKTQATGVFPQALYGQSIQTSPLQSKTDRPNIMFQEDDLETFKEMILSIVQQLYSLYKDQSNCISIKVHRFYSKEGFFNPLLKFRKKFLTESIKQNLLLLQQKQNYKNHQQYNYGQHQQTTTNQQVSQQLIAQIQAKNQYQINSKTLKNLQHKRSSIQLVMEKKNDGPLQPSMSNIQNVSSKISPIKILKQSQLLQLNEQCEIPQQQNQIQEEQQNHQQQISEDTTENNQSFNQNTYVNQSQINNQVNNPNQPQSATKKNQQLNNITNMPELVSQAMSNSNYYNQNNIQNYQNALQPFMAKLQWQISAKHSLNESKQSLTNSGQQRSNLSPQHIDQSAAINYQGSPRDNLLVDSQYVEEIIEKGRYRKLRVARVNVEITQNIYNDQQTSQMQKNTQILSQMEEYIQYLSPIPLIYQRKQRDQQVIHSYSFYIENYVYSNNLPDNFINENNYYNESQYQNCDKIDSYQQENQFEDQRDKQNHQKEIIDYDELEIVSLDDRKEVKNQQREKKFTHQNLDRISEKNLREERNYSDASQSQLQRLSYNNKEQSKQQSKQLLQPSSRAQLFVENNNTPFLSYQNSNIGSFQKSQDNLEIATDRKFLKSANNEQVREQQVSFNGKLDGTQSPFNEITQDYTQIDLIRENERKNYSTLNLNNYSVYNEASNNGFSDRQYIDEASAERKLSENIAKITRGVEDTTARPQPSRSVEKIQLQQQLPQKELDTYPSNRMIQSIPPDELIRAKKESHFTRDRELSSDNVINQVKDSEGLMKNVFQISQIGSLAKQNNQKPQNQNLKRKSSNSFTSKAPDNQSECSEFEYKKDLVDERDEKELTIILERSEQNNSLYNNTHYKNQLSKQFSSKINDQYASNQHSILNYKSQFQSQLLSDDQKQNYSYISRNIALNSQGTRDLQQFLDSQQYDGKSLLHQNIQVSTYQHQLNSFLSVGGNQNNLTSQNIENKQLSKDEQGNKDLTISQKMN